ncbi:MAG: transketolase [Candidatus Zixiibacteriota bacterium]
MGRKHIMVTKEAGTMRTEANRSFSPWRGFHNKQLSEKWHTKLSDMARRALGEIIKMTTVAASGHPGGSMSSLEIYLTLYNMARVDPENPTRDDRDRIIISHGHTSPGVYASLAAAGFFDIVPALSGFRVGGSPFEGHVERSVPGIEWDTGNLGQGLSAGIGKALYSRLTGMGFHSYVVMGDGEQQKGQIAEARRFAKKYNLDKLTVIIDYNHLQISGNIDDIMPHDLKACWKADGWNVVEIDGHDLHQVYQALQEATHSKSGPTMILARTVMGKGVSFMENDHAYHGAPLKPDRAAKALAELGAENDLDQLSALRAQGPPPAFSVTEQDCLSVDPGTPITYGIGDKLDNRSAFGNALVSVAKANMERDDYCMAVFDCDLAGSVKTSSFAKEFPDCFFQCGISEHSTATMAGSLSAERALSIWADFGVFAIDETYNQARLNDINHTNLKLACTHCGVSVGEDGKTHQCIDYFGLLNSTFGWKVITPADPNQTDRAVRYILSNPGNFALIMGRAIEPILTDGAGNPFFGDRYQYVYGRMDILRSGQHLALVSAGNMMRYAMKAWNMLHDQGTDVTLVSISDWSDIHTDDLAMLAAYEQVVVLEDHNVKTGLGQMIASSMFEHGMSTRLTKMGVHQYASSGKPDELFKLLGIDAEAVMARVRNLLGMK